MLRAMSQRGDLRQCFVRGPCHRFGVDVELLVGIGDLGFPQEFCDRLPLSRRASMRSRVPFENRAWICSPGSLICFPPTRGIAKLKREALSQDVHAYELAEEAIEAWLKARKGAETSNRS
jgi:hypothetical protein